ncbi:hypothetical protein [Methylotenera sp.]|uniref:hypothetical protein n=1 Tax=Methylotenera sp. TaxID=2051956 RepID=UPI002EDA8FC6
MDANKVLYIGALAGFWLWITKKPKYVINILATNAAQKAVQYEVKYNGVGYTDTFYYGDQPNSVPLIDGKVGYTVTAPSLNAIQIHIGYFEPNNGFKSNYSKTIEF